MGATDDIRVNAAGLDVLAHACEQLAGDLTAAGTTVLSNSPDGVPGQPSAVAIRTGHALVSDTATRLAARMIATAAEARAAAATYTTTDEAAAARIAAVGSDVVEV